MAITQEKAKTIAQCFAATNFLNKSLALRNAGYSPKYAKGIGQYLLDNVRVKAEIDRIQAETSEKVELSIESQVKETKELLKNAKEANHHTAALTANDQLNRHIGFYNADISGGLSILDIMAVVGISVTEPQEAG